MKSETIEQIISSLPATWQQKYLYVAHREGYTWLSQDEFWRYDSAWNPEDKIYLATPDFYKCSDTKGSLKSEANFRWLKANFSKLNWLEFEDALYISVHRIKGKLKDTLLSNNLLLDELIDHQTYLDIIEEEKIRTWDDIKKDFTDNLEWVLENESNYGSDILKLIPDMYQFFEAAVYEYDWEWTIEHDSVWIAAEEVALGIESDFLDAYFGKLQRQLAKAAGQQELF